MARQKDAFKELHRQKLKADRLFKLGLKDRCLKYLEGVTINNGISLDEIASHVFKKKVITQKDKGEIYRILQKIRSDNDILLCYRRKSYGWAENKNDVDIQVTRSLINATKKIKRQFIRTPKNYEALGIKDDAIKEITKTLIPMGIKEIGFRKERGE